MKRKTPNKKERVSDICGISEERADDLVRAFKIAKINNDNWKDVLNEVRKTASVETVGSALFLGWIFRSLYDAAQKEMSFSGLLEKLMD